MKKNQTINAAAILALSLFTAASLNAQLLNGSFEAGSVAPTTTNNWTLGGNVIVQQYTFTLGNPGFEVGVTNGIWALVFNPGNDEIITGTASQTFTTSIGQEYTLAFDFGKYGDNSGFAPSTSQLNILVTGAGNLLSTSVQDASGSAYDLSGGPGSTYSSFNFNFIANSALSTLTFTDASTSAFAADTALDNVSVTAVPEPSGILMLVAGGVALVGVVRANRRKV